MNSYLIARAIVETTDIRPSSHHMKIKAAFKRAGAEEMAVSFQRTLLERAISEQVKEAEAAAAAVAAMDPSVSAGGSRRRSAKRAGKAPKQSNPMAGLERFAGKIVRVTDLGTKGQAKRVDILCQLPGCDVERNIATQDLFQVAHCCIAHKRAHQKLIAAGQAV